MSHFEYRVIPAPRRGLNARGLRTTEGKFANALAELMNEMGQAGWQFQRSETLPCEERKGLTKKTVNYHAMLVFRRPMAAPKPENYVEPVALIEDFTRRDAEPIDPEDMPDHLAPTRSRGMAAE